MLLHINTEDQLLEQLSAATKSDQLVVLEFTSPRCPPCSKIAPLIEEYSRDNPDLLILAVNVDEVPDTIEMFDLRATPTFVFLLQGNRVHDFSGANFDKFKQIVATNHKKRKSDNQEEATGTSTKTITESPKTAAENINEDLSSKATTTKASPESQEEKSSTINYTKPTSDDQEEASATTTNTITESPKTAAQNINENLSIAIAAKASITEDPESTSNIQSVTENRDQQEI